MVYNILDLQLTNFASLEQLLNENDRKPLRGEEHVQPELFEHFAVDNHNSFLNDCSITLIDKTDNSDATRREDYCRKALKTVAPYGLNTLN